MFIKSLSVSFIKSLYKFASLLILLTLLHSTIALSQSIIVGSVSTVGSGCPSGTASVSVSPDNSAISVLFDAYSLRIGGTTKLNVAILDCKIVVPVTLPLGTSIMLDSLDYRGFASLPQSAVLMFGTRDGFHNGNNHHEDPADRITKLMGVFQDNFILTRKRPLQIWSRCGDQVQLTSYSRLQVRTNPQLQEAIASIDSADGTFGVKFNLVTHSCTNEPAQPILPPSPVSPRPPLIPPPTPVRPMPLIPPRPNYSKPPILIPTSSPYVSD